MEITNEVLQMVIYYHMFLFTDFTTDLESRYYMGHSLLIFLCLTSLVNLLGGLVETINKFSRTQQLKNLKKIHDCKLAECEENKKI